MLLDSLISSLLQSLVPLPPVCAAQKRESLSALSAGLPGPGAVPGTQRTLDKLLREWMIRVRWVPCGVLCGSNVMVAVPSSGLSSLVTSRLFVGVTLLGLNMAHGGAQDRFASGGKPIVDPTESDPY